MPLKSPRPIISVPNLAHTTGFPLRGLPNSVGAHIVVIVFFLLLGLAPVTIEGPLHLRQRPERVDLQPEPEDAPLLPELQSSSASASSPASASARSALGRNAASSASSMPLIHQRRQHIISNTPDASNPVQTILQPDIHNAPRLTKTLPVPSMVRMAAVQHAPTLTAPTLSAVAKPAAPPAPTPAPQPAPPKIKPANVDTVALTSATELADSPKIAAYATHGRAYQPPKPPPPPPAAVAKPSAPTVAAKGAPNPASTGTPAGGSDTRNLLVVNAFEVQATMEERDIPPAEIHGRFEVTARPSLPEAPTTGGSSSSAGVNGSGVANSGDGAGKGLGAKSAAGAGTGGSHGNGAGTGNANIAGAGAGHGTGLGNGTGSGTGHAAAPGMGNGTGNGPAGGSGAAPFSGMTIVGGTGANGAVRQPPNNANVDANNPRGGYGLTILSAAGSGGAVRDYGVFTDGPVYTVYLDLDKIGIHGSRWSLQYSASRDARLAHPGVPLTPPLPQDEKLPQLPPEAVTHNLGRLVVIQAVLKADGKLEGFHVLETPDQRLNEGLIASLTHWYFDPAAMGGDKIPVKVLFGIPIAAPMADTGLGQQADQRTPGDAAARTPAQ